MENSAANFRDLAQSILHKGVTCVLHKDRQFTELHGTVTNESVWTTDQITVTQKKEVLRENMCPRATLTTNNIDMNRPDTEYGPM
jgi:hypothetical protein